MKTQEQDIWTRQRQLRVSSGNADNVKVSGNVQLDETFVSEAFFLAAIIFARGSSQLRLNYVRT